MARPTKKNPKGKQKSPKFTEQTIEKLRHVFALDGTIEEACFYADISTASYYGWVKKNPKLLDEFTRIRNKPILQARNEVVKGLNGNPEFSLKYLERKRRAEFAPSVKVTDQDGNALTVNLINYGGSNNTPPVRSGAEAVPAKSARKPSKIQVASYPPKSGQDSSIDK